MTSMLQKVNEAGGVSVFEAPYEVEWGQIDSAGDLAAFQ